MLLQACAANCAACDYGSRWDCVDHFTFPQPVTSATTIRFTVSDVATRALIDGDVKLCSYADPLCVRDPPLFATRSSWGRGSVVAQLEPTFGFEGYLEIDHDPPNLLAFQRIVGSSYFVWSVLDHATANALLAFAGDSFDPKTDAGLALATLDCAGAKASGIVVQLDPPYENETVHYSSLNDTATNAGGFAAIVFHGLPLGKKTDLVRFHGTLGSKRLVSGEAVVRIGAITEAPVLPIPL